MIKDEFRRLAYGKWNAIHKRCGKLQGYLDVGICEEWSNFENFYQWMLEKKENGEYFDGWEIDKDVLQPCIKNKVYSPNTCISLPSRINTAIINVDIYSPKPLKGFGWDKYRNKWQIKLKMWDKTVHLGRFDNLVEGFSAYKEAKINYINALVKEDDKLSNEIKDNIVEYVKVNMEYRLEQLKEVKKCINNTD